MAGRPPTTGEKRTQKLTLFLSKGMEKDIQDLSRIYGETTAVYVLGLISKDIEAQRAKLQAFRELRNS